MLTHYRKENRKIAMGLLSFHKKLTDKSNLLKEINTYETEEGYELFFFTPEGSTNIQGIIGVYWGENQELIIHDVSLNPSYRGDQMGFQMLDELQEKYPDFSIRPTEITPSISRKMGRSKQEERVNMVTEINIKLDIFEGPLDLLLHLIQQMEIDIYDIPIATITEQYMSYIHTMKTLELAVAGEYLVMAATLMAIKSKTLLPVQEAIIEDEYWEEDPRDELVNQLLEYRKYKYAAEQLTEKAQERSLYYTKEPVAVDDLIGQEKPLKRGQVKKIDLFHAMEKILERKKFSEKVEKTITPDDTTIEERIIFIEERLKQHHKGCSFESFFETPSKTEVVTTFMALLEMMKNGQIVAQQERNYETIMLYLAVGDTKDDKIK